jgi:hypothetical protein
MVAGERGAEMNLLFALGFALALVFVVPLFRWSVKFGERLSAGTVLVLVVIWTLLALALSKVW